MANTVNTIISSRNAQVFLNPLQTHQTAKRKSLNRRSPRFRINRNDIVTITEKATAKQSALQLNNLVNLVPKAETAFSEITKRLQNIRDIVEQSPLISDNNRKAIQTEKAALTKELFQVAGLFHGEVLLDRKTADRVLQSVQKVRQGINLLSTEILSVSNHLQETVIVSSDYNATFSASSLSSVAVNSKPITGFDVKADGTVVVGDVKINGTVVIASTDDSAVAKAKAVNDSGITGVTATAQPTQVLGAKITKISQIDSGDISINGFDIGEISGFTHSPTAGDILERAKALKTAINRRVKGITAVVNDTNDGVNLTADDGRNITIKAGGVHTSTESGFTAGTNTTRSTIAFTSTAESGLTFTGGSFLGSPSDELAITINPLMKKSDVIRKAVDAALKTVKSEQDTIDDIKDSLFSAIAELNSADKQPNNKVTDLSALRIRFSESPRQAILIQANIRSRSFISHLLGQNK